MKTITIFLTLVLAGGCAHTNPTPPAPTNDAGPSGNCSTACANGARLGCPWASPTPAGATCQVVCANAAQTVPWNVAALTTAATCTP